MVICLYVSDYMLSVLTLCSVFPSSCLPDLLPPLFRHVCMVLLEDHLHQACQPLQRGTITRFSKTSPLSMHVYTQLLTWGRPDGCNFVKICLFHSSSAFPRLRRSVMRRKRGQSPNRRSYGELPPVFLCTPAQEPEVRLSRVSKCETVRVRMNLSACLHPLCLSCSVTRHRCVDMMQQSVTVTAVKLSSLTGVITAPRVTCKKTIDIFLFQLYLPL